MRRPSVQAWFPQVGKAFLVLLVLTHAVLVGVFRRDQDIQSIKGFGAITVVDGRAVIGQEGRCVCVPLGTQFRLDKGAYFTYDPEWDNPAIRASSEANLQAPWVFLSDELTKFPRTAKEGQRHQGITEVRVQADSGAHKGWYLGVDRAAVKDHEALVAKNPDRIEDKPPVWPLILVQDRDDALVFVHRITYIYRGAK